MEIGRFYETRGQWLAATLRFRRVIEQYQTTTHAPEALMRLTETYLALGTPLEAQKSAAVLGANYPGTEWYERAYKLMKDHPAAPLPAVPTGTEIVPAGTPGARPSLPGDAAATPKAEAPGTPTPVAPSGGTTGTGTPTTETPTT